MKLILWAGEEEVVLKTKAQVITSEEADMDAEEYFMVDVDEEAGMAEEAGKNSGYKQSRSDARMVQCNDGTQIEVNTAYDF